MKYIIPSMLAALSVPIMSSCSHVQNELPIYEASSIGFATHHDQKTEVDVQVTDLGHGFYELRTDQSGNVLMLVGDQGVVMVDSQMEHLVESIDAAREDLSEGQDVKLVLNTHLHRDHVRGNAYFAARGAQIIAHPNVRKFLKTPRAIKSLGRDAPEIGGNYLPTISVTSGSSLNMNGQTGQLYHVPAAHTDGDIFVHFEEANIIHAGDLLASGRFPFIDIDNGGSVKGYIAGMEKILDIANADTVIVAGHGPTSSETELKASIQMLNETHSIIEGLLNKGLSLASMQETNPLKEYNDIWDWDFIGTDRMVSILYYDLTGKLE